MEIIIACIICLLFGVAMFYMIFIYSEGEVFIELLTKVNHAPQVGVIIAPYIVMNYSEFGTAYTKETWLIAIGLVLLLLLITIVIQFIIILLTNRTEKIKAKKAKEKIPPKKTFKQNIISLIEQMQQSFIGSTVLVPVLIIANAGRRQLFKPITIGTIIYALLLYFICKLILKKLTKTNKRT